MKNFLFLGLVLFCAICFGQNYGGYTQLQPLQGSVSQDMQQAQANAYRHREEQREIERIKNEREQKNNEPQSQKEYELADRKAIYKACINSNVVSKLYLFGGKDGKVPLGCLNCDKFETSSIWNDYGKFGSKYNSECIWNKYGSYGGKYGEYSPFNEGSTPPKIFDDKGNFIGYFTANKYYTYRKNNELLDAICERWEAISENIGEMTR